MTRHQCWGIASGSCAAVLLLLSAVGCSQPSESGSAAPTSKGAEGPMQAKIPPAVEANAQKRAADLEKMAKERAMAQQAKH